MTCMKGEGILIVAENKKARFKYHIIEKFEAGIVLKGSEVKSLRDRKVSITESYARIYDGEIFLIGMNISPYQHAGVLNHDPTRRRKLLMHKREIQRIAAKVREKGFTIVPLMVYFKRGIAKVQLALVKGKAEYDKREAIKKREAEREMRRRMRFK